MKKKILISVLALCDHPCFPCCAKTGAHAPISIKEWTDSCEPFRIAGNLYYIGTYDLACYLVATPKGHILINTGLAESVPMIKKNMEQLGFKMADIKILLYHPGAFRSCGRHGRYKKTHRRQNDG